MDQSLDGGLKPKTTNSRGTKNIINPIIYMLRIHVLLVVKLILLKK